MVLLTDKETVLCLMLVVKEPGMNQGLAGLTAVCYCATLLERFVLSFGKQPIERQQSGHFDEWLDSDLQ